MILNMIKLKLQRLCDANGQSKLCMIPIAQSVQSKENRQQYIKDIPRQMKNFQILIVYNVNTNDNNFTRQYMARQALCYDKFRDSTCHA
jgi:hypothetical protein